MTILGAIKGRAREIVLRVAPPVARGSAMANIGAGRAARLRIIAGVLRLHARERFRLTSGNMLCFELRRPGGVVSVWVDSVFDLNVIEQLYMHGEYDAPLIDARIIVDAGSNIGLAAIDFALRYAGARIVAIEPDPTAVAKLIRNVSAFPQITVAAVALGASPGSRTFWSGSDTWASGFTRTHAAQAQIRVPTKTLDQVLADAGVSDDVDILKLDVEGAEGEVLASFSRLSRIGQILGEVHGLPESPESTSILDAIRAAGFAIEVTHCSSHTQTFIATNVGLTAH
jgi:FkbM family methyltransferase